MKYLYKRLLWVTDFQGFDFSFGIHICLAGRVDIHFLRWMISVGNVPIYQTKNMRRVSVGNSYHKTKELPMRAGTP